MLNKNFSDLSSFLGHRGSWTGLTTVFLKPTTTEGNVPPHAVDKTLAELLHA
jgi:hypothetical protein